MLESTSFSNVLLEVVCDSVDLIVRHCGKHFKNAARWDPGHE